MENCPVLTVSSGKWRGSRPASSPGQADTAERDVAEIVADPSTVSPRSPS